MKKIKKIIKKHYKKAITLFCVIVSLFALSFSSLAQSTNQQLSGVQVQAYKNSSHNAVSVRSWSPTANMLDDINEYNSSVFSFGSTEKVNFLFTSWDVGGTGFEPAYSNEYNFLQIPFSFAFAGQSLVYFKVVGFEVAYGVSGTMKNMGNNYFYDLGQIVSKQNYNNVSVSTRKGSYKYGTSIYTSLFFDVILNIPIEYHDKPIVYVSVVLEFSGVTASSNTSFYMSNYYGLKWYQNAIDGEFNTPTVTPDEDNILNEYEQSENNLNDLYTDNYNELGDLLTPGSDITEQGLKPVMALGQVFNYLVDGNKKLYTLVYFSLAIGIFPYVVNIINSTIGKRGS